MGPWVQCLVLRLGLKLGFGGLEKDRGHEELENDFLLLLKNVKFRKGGNSKIISAKIK